MNQSTAPTEAIPGLPLSGDPAFDAFLREFLHSAVRDFASGRCSQCGQPRGETATGTLCQRCSDHALLDIAASAGVRSIASDAWGTDDYPTADHPIWDALARTLNHRKRGTSVADLYPVLEGLQLCETLTVLDTDEGQLAFERVALPHSTLATERCWLIVWSERYASFLVGTFTGEQRDTRLLAAIATLTQRHDRATRQSTLDEDHPFASKVYFRL